MERITKFQQDSNSTQAFKGLSKDQFINGLVSRLENPALINQDRTSLCGPAVVMYTMLKKQQNEFVDFAIDLFQFGEAKLGGMHIKPGDATLAMSTLKLETMQTVDWVTLASLRDSENSVLKVDKLVDQAAGITLPNEITDWFKQIGFIDVANKTDIIGTKNIDNLLSAQQVHSSGNSVCILINSDILRSANPNTSSGVIPDHWVVLSSDIKVDGITLTADRAEQLENERRNYIHDTFDDFGRLEVDKTFNHTISFTSYTWGRPQHKVGNSPDQQVNLHTFLDYYYGFVNVQ